MNEKQDVLKAILNVKKYAKDLKRNATTMQEIAINEYETDDVVSSPSFLEGKRQTYPDEGSSPLMFTKSSFGDAVAKYQGSHHHHKKKDLSMNLLPKKKDILQRNQLKIKEQSRNSSIDKSARSQQLTQSHKYEHIPCSQSKPVLSKESKNRSFQKKSSHQVTAGKNLDKQGNQSMFQLYEMMPSTLHRRRSHNSSTSNQVSALVTNKDKNREIEIERVRGINREKQTNPMNNNNNNHNSVEQKQKNRDPPTNIRKQIQNPELVSELLDEIKMLKAQLTTYKHAFLLVKQKYLQNQAKAQMKAQSDHIIDVLKLQIQQLQENNSRLTSIIDKQNEKIRNFYHEISQVSFKLMGFYKSQTQSLVKLETQNQYLRDLTALRNISSLTLEFPVSHSSPSHPSHPSATNSNQQPHSDSQSENQPIYLDSAICRNEEDLKKKYNQIDSQK